MNIGEICTTNTITCNRETTVQQAAEMMRHQHVGDLVVVEQPDGERIPVGIVTDRDIVISVIALGLDPTSILVGDIMGDELMTASEDEDVYEATERMRFKGIRRLPVVNRAGNLVGIISVDDLLSHMAEEMTELARISARQPSQEKQTKK